jgi:hypothetical protein
MLVRGWRRGWEAGEANSDHRDSGLERLKSSQGRGRLSQRRTERRTRACEVELSLEGPEPAQVGRSLGGIAEPELTAGE